MTRVAGRLARFAEATSTRFSSALRRRQLEDVSMGGALAIHTHMTAGELNVLYDLASRAGANGRVLEIGSYLGASSARIAAALAMHGGHLYCVDTWSNETMPEGERDTFTEFQRNTANASALITMIRKRSDELTASDVPFPLDLVFIDADHSYTAVKGDFEIVRDWIRDDGVLAFHDTTYFEAVSRVLGEILATGQWQLLGNVDSLVWLRKVGATGTFPNPMTPEERALHVRR